MAKKMSLQEFRKVKERLKDYYHPVDVKKELLSYDLSNIPFEEWRGMDLRNMFNALDYSKTRANIDFEIFDVKNCYSISSLKGCNIKNLYKLEENTVLKIFDKDIIKKYLSPLSTNLFNEEFINKYNNKSLSIEDLIDLSDEQISILKEKYIINHFNSNEGYAIRVFAIDKLIELYNYSKEDYEFVICAVNLSRNIPYIFDSNFKWTSLDEISKHSNDIKVSEMKEVCNTYLKDMIFNNTEIPLFPENFPKLFVEENKEMFLIDKSIDENLKNRFYQRNLSLDDIIENIDLFTNLPIEKIVENYEYFEISDLSKALGNENLIKILKKYPDVIKNILSYPFHHDFCVSLKNYNYDLEKNFILAVKDFYINYHRPLYDIPDWIESMNFEVVDKLYTYEDLKNYTDKTLLLDTKQQNAINILGIDNIRKLDEETKIFSHELQYENLDMFNAVSDCLNINKNISDIRFYDEAAAEKEFYDISNSFKNGTLPYAEFRENFAKLLDLIRSKSIFEKYKNYDYVEGKFREDFKEIFIDHEVLDSLKEAFYRGKITLQILHKYKEDLKYFKDKNLSALIAENNRIKLVYGNEFDFFERPNVSFIKEYTSRYGNEKLLNLIAKYGTLLSDLTLESANGEIEDEEKIENCIKQAIYKKIINSTVDYSSLQDVPEFVEEHPQLFVDFKQISNIPSGYLVRLEQNYYKGSLIFDDIKNHPQLVDILKNKNLKRCFSKVSIFRRDLELLDAYGNIQFLKLCEKYGVFMTDIVRKLYDEKIIYHASKFIKDNKELTFDEMDKLIEDIVTRDCILGNLPYNSEDAPEFLKRKHPELFLSEDAPSALKKLFYNDFCNMYFQDLKENYNEWKPYLEGKSISTSLLRNAHIHDSFLKFIEVFGKDVAIKLGIKKPETVDLMLISGKINVMKKWYDKTGCKFIPDYVVMQDFPLEEADKFLSSGSNWTSLMKIKEFSKDSDSKDAMLKLAYSFGAFDNDQRGFKKLKELLTKIPKNIDIKNNSIIGMFDSEIDKFSKRNYFFKDYKETNGLSNEEAYNDMIEYNKYKEVEFDMLDQYTLLDFFKALKEEVPNFDFSKPIFSELYKLNEDGSCTLTINPQSCPKTTKIVRNILKRFVTLNILTPEKAHQLFGGFKLEYNPEFREFLLDNLDEILNNGEYATYIASIQKQFKEIKRTNINRKLTLDLAISYVQSNKYENVEVGNERVSEISAIAGYDQEDFDTLQKIYNYGKQRTYSSIPRIENEEDEYHYEMLRLDDPLAMAVGTLSNCCQAIGNMAEVCMEHSMVDKNGRVFIIKDKERNIVAQSWVWRNKDVICFDNIEIPDKAFKRAENSNISRKEFSNEIYKIYEKAAQELIKKDEEEYKKLLENGKITEEQYEGLRLKKVTVGLGYNDIAEAIKKQAKYDNNISRPLPFKPPVDLGRNLYTSDSATQYILEGEKIKNTYNGDILPIYNDIYIEYDDTNFDERKLLTLSKLEEQTKGYSDNLDILIDEGNEKHIVTEIADNYDLKPETTKIIMNPNFAVIYEASDDKIIIADIVYNTKIENEDQNMDIESIVIMQIRLAIEQIGKNKEIDISKLDKKSREIYNKAINLKHEIDIERGVCHAK